ncbi:MAG: HNH endonuclease [Bacteroidales bacterium]|nr:HNH endonuclease [Candidatus Scybalousia scybalohippi]
MAREFSKSFYNSIEWQRVREYVMARDHHTCVKCGAVAEEVHHIIHLTKENIGDTSITLNADNLICLCKDCHFKEHKEDKYNGTLKAKGIPEYEYVFDENGMLVRKKKDN